MTPNNPAHHDVVNEHVGAVSLEGLDLPHWVEGEAADSKQADPRALLSHLLALDVAALPEDYDVVEVIAGWERLRAWIEARRAEALVEFARRGEASERLPRGEVARPFPAEELAPRLSVSPRIVASWLTTAVALEHRLPTTAAAFSDGRIDGARAAMIVHECRHLDDDGAREVENRLAHRLTHQAPASLRQTLRRRVAALDPAGANVRRRRAESDRYVRIERADDGMAFLTALLPAEQALAIDTALDAAARSARRDDPTDVRTLAQLRADLLAWPFTQALRTGVLTGPTDQRLARHRGRRPQINVTVGLTTLLALDEEPGELEGYGPIPAPVARRIAAEGTWRRIITDPASGTVLDVGRTTYLPPADLAHHVEIRDRTCRYPGCAVPAARCDLDHVVPFPHGPTSADDLIALCRRHHRFKHHTPDEHLRPAGSRSRCESRMNLQRLTHGTVRWHLPTGHTADVQQHDWA
jgi:Domain of unknown function (DUF222)